MDFREILRTRRRELGLTLEDVAHATDVTRATVQRWESGTIQNVRYDKLANLAKILQVSPAFLMGADSETEESKTAQDLALCMEALQDRPELLTLCSICKDASQQDVLRTVAIVKALKETAEK